MKILAISDQVVPRIYSPHIRERFRDIEMVISCGDLPYSYMEYIVTMLSVPCFYVHGNHDHPEHMQGGDTIREPGGWINLDRRVIKARGVLLGGLEGSIRYKPYAPYQYSESAMTSRAWCMVLPLLVNRILYRRSLDILATHAPPKGIHDGQDLPHHGFKTLLRFMDRYRPRYLLHGHQHFYVPSRWRTRYKNTDVINVYPFRLLDLEIPEAHPRRNA